MSMSIPTDAGTLLMLLGALFILAALLAGSLGMAATKTRTVTPLTRAILALIGAALLVSGGWAKLGRALAEREHTDATTAPTQVVCRLTFPQMSSFRCPLEGDWFFGAVMQGA
jgi:hypothetical protein